MTIEEAKVKFPIGSTVCVEDSSEEYSRYDMWAAKHLSLAEFKEWNKKEFKRLVNGDVGTVVAVADYGGIDTDYPIIAIRVDGKKIFLMGVEGVEPLTPPSRADEDTACKNAEPFVFCEDDKDYAVAFNGSELVVTAYGETAKVDVHDLVDQLREECMKKKNEIKVGDKVMITDPGYCYTTYTKWLKEHATFEQAIMFDLDREPSCGDCAEVVAIAPHEDDGEPLYLIRIGHGFVDHTYLIDKNGIKKI